jgi:hypothetical protein
MLLTQEQQIALREWEALFASPGWERLMQYFRAYEESLRAPILAGELPEKQIDHLRGQRYILGLLLGWEEGTIAEFEQYQLAAEESAEEERAGQGANA